MANEKRRELIDRKDLIKAAQEKKFAIADNTHPYEAMRIQGKYFREVVDNVPTVDAVEVVRCKNCQYWNPRYETMGMCMKHNAIVTFTKPDFFCAWGKGKTDGFCKED